MIAGPPDRGLEFGPLRWSTQRFTAQPRGLRPIPVFKSKSMLHEHLPAFLTCTIYVLGACRGPLKLGLLVFAYMNVWDCLKFS